VVGDGLGDEVSNGVAIKDIGRPPKSRMARAAVQSLRMLRHIRRLSPDVVHLHDPELLPLGLLFSWSGKKVIYDAHEDVPRQILAKPWIRPVFRRTISRVFERLENFIARRLAGVVCATPHIAARFRPLNEKTIDINNYPLIDELAPVERKDVLPRAICYVGGISRIRGISQLVAAIALVPNVRLILCGSFSDRQLEDEISSLPGWSKVEFRGQVGREELKAVMGNCIAGVVTFLPLPNHIDAQPNKMFEYMSAELPVVASDFPLWRKLIVGSGAGVCVDPEQPADIARGINMLLDDPVGSRKLGEAGRRAVMACYNWPAEAEKLINFYGELA